jgi:HAD superfamily hydrolase (TIGR01509 family)
MGRPISLIIFDCDGVLVDSEPLAIEVLIQTIARAGARVSLDEAYENFLGRSLSSISKSLSKSHGVALTDADLAAMRHDLYALYRQKLTIMPGVRETLSRLTIPFCVASSSHLERLTISLELTGLLPWFEPNVFSASMVPHGKPAPDLFLHAAAAMHADPAECLVIEDSPAGITAARAAGMRVFGFTGGSHVGPGKLAPAIAALAPDCIFHDMQALPDLVGSPPVKKKAL